MTVKPVVCCVLAAGLLSVALPLFSPGGSARRTAHRGGLPFANRASARQLADLGRRAFRDERYWTSPPDNAWRWDRRSAYPDEYGLAVEVREQAGERPTMTVRGSYY